MRNRAEGKARAAKAREGAQRTRTAAGMQAEGLTGFVSDEKMMKFHAFYKTRKALVYRGEAVLCGRVSLRGVPRPLRVPTEKTRSSAQKSCRGQERAVTWPWTRVACPQCLSLRGASVARLPWSVGRRSCPLVPRLCASGTGALREEQR